MKISFKKMKYSFDHTEFQVLYLGLWADPHSKNVKEYFQALGNDTTGKYGLTHNN